MELDKVLVWVVGINASVLVVQGLRMPDLPRAQLRVQLLTLAVLGLGALVFPAWMGRVARPSRSTPLGVAPRPCVVLALVVLQPAGAGRG